MHFKAAAAAAAAAPPPSAASFRRRRRRSAHPMNAAMKAGGGVGLVASNCKDTTC
jgi:hypothetical protein